MDIEGWVISKIEIERGIKELLECYPDKLSQMIALLWMIGYSFGDIAEVTGESRSWTGKKIKQGMDLYIMKKRFQ